MAGQRTIRKKVKVPLYGQPAGRVANIEDGATMGAAIGSTLYYDDGTIVTLENLATRLDVGGSSSSSSLGSLAVTLWRLIREVPIYTESPISPTWEYTLDGAPIGNVGFAAVANGIAAGSLAGDLVLAPVAGRVFLPDAISLIAISSSADAIRAGAGTTDGYATLSRGTGTTAPGYARFYDAAGVSRGYVGFHDSSSRITLTSENAWGIKLASAADNLVQATTINRLISVQAQLGAATTLPFLAMNGTTPFLVAGGSGATDAFWMIQRYNAAGGGPDLAMYHSRGASIGTHTILQNGDELGSISFYASDGTATPVKTARIIAFVNGVVSGATDLPSRISILTTPDGSATNQVTAFFSPEEIELNATTFDLNGSLDVSGTSLLTGDVNVRGILYLNPDPQTIPAAAINADSRAVIADNGSTSDTILVITAAGSSGRRHIHAGGTFAVPTAVDTTNTTYMGFIGGAGFDGTTWQTASAGLVGIRPAGTWSGTARPTRVTIETTALASTTRVVTAFFDPAEIELNATLFDFNGNLDVSGTSTLTGTVSVLGATGFGSVGIASGGDITVTKTSASLYLNDTAAGADGKLWRWGNIAGTLFLQTRTDANAAGVNVLQFTRTGTASTEFEANAGTFDFNGVMVLGGAGISSNPLRIIAADSLGDGYMSFYSSDESTRRGYFGYGATTTNDLFLVQEATADLAIAVPSGRSILLSGNNLSGIHLTVTSTEVRSGVREYNASGGFQTVGGASDTGVNAVHCILDVNAGAGRLVAYNWGTAVLQPLQISGSTVLITGLATFDSNPTISKTAPVLRMVDTGGSVAAMSAYVSMRDGTTERGWMGFGLGTAVMSMVNTIGQLTLTGSGEIELNATTLDFNGNEDLSGALLWTGVVTPSALAAGDNDNVNLGVGSVIRARIAGNATTSNLTSVTGGSDGKLLILTNTSANTIMIINEDAGGTAANRFAINGDMVLPQNCSAIFIYDGNISRWTRLN